MIISNDQIIESKKQKIYKYYLDNISKPRNGNIWVQRYLIWFCLPTFNANSHMLMEEKSWIIRPVINYCWWCKSAWRLMRCWFIQYPKINMPHKRIVFSHSYSWIIISGSLFDKDGENIFTNDWYRYLNQFLFSYTNQYQLQLKRCFLCIKIMLQIIYIQIYIYKQKKNSWKK